MNAHAPRLNVAKAMHGKSIREFGDPEMHTMFVGLIDLDDPEAPPTLAEMEPTAIERAEKAFADAARHWLRLYQASFDPDGIRELADSGYDHLNLTEARSWLFEAQQHHADVVEIQAIGDLGGTWVLKPGYRCLDLCRDADDENGVLQIPRGLTGHVVRTIIGAYNTGLRHGGNEVRTALADLQRLR